MRTYRELDVVIYAGETIEDVMTKLTDGTGATWILLNAAGPAGGWPNVLVIGKSDELDTVIKRYNAGDESNAINPQLV